MVDQSRSSRARDDIVTEERVTEDAATGEEATEGGVAEDGVEGIVVTVLFLPCAQRLDGVRTPGTVYRPGTGQQRTQIAVVRDCGPVPPPATARRRRLCAAAGHLPRADQRPGDRHHAAALVADRIEVLVARRPVLRPDDG